MSQDRARPDVGRRLRLQFAAEKGPVIIRLTLRTLGAFIMVVILVGIGCSTLSTSHGQAIGGPTLHTKSKPNTGSNVCYYCDPNDMSKWSPGGAGCEYGQVQAPYTAYGVCQSTINPSSTCTDQEWQCGGYFLCTAPFTNVGTCLVNYWASY